MARAAVEKVGGNIAIEDNIGGTVVTIRTYREKDR